MPDVFPEDLLALTYTRIQDANNLKVDIDLIAKSWTTIDDATPYSLEKFAFSHTHIDDADSIKTDIDLFAETWTQIDDVVYGEYLDIFFILNISGYEDWDFELHDAEPYLDTNFIFITGDIIDIPFFVPIPHNIDHYFIAGLAQYADINFEAHMKWYLVENDFRMKHVQTFLGYNDHLFIIKVTSFVFFSLKLITLPRQLPATIAIRGNIDD